MNERSGPLRILLVEDNPGDVQLVVTRLADLPTRHTLVSAGLIREAEALLISEPFDVLLLDLNLPHGAGRPLAPEMMGLVDYRVGIRRHSSSGSPS
jgi:CheY-like chemotaxis protein